MSVQVPRGRSVGNHHWVAIDVFSGSTARISCPYLFARNPAASGREPNGLLPDSHGGLLRDRAAGAAAFGLKAAGFGLFPAKPAGGKRIYQSQKPRTQKRRTGHPQKKMVLARSV